jgi:flavin reductase (DIM6/NTAB) family NADH-FMN oxidoreductase RutF
VIIDPKNHQPDDIYKVMIGSITPRPIAFVSTISKEGIYNLAPYSFFTGIGANPPVIGFSPVINREGRSRDSKINAEETGQFVVNIVSEKIVHEMNQTAVDVPSDVDEFRLSGLTPTASKSVTPPRVKEAQVSMECKVLEVIEVSKKTLGGTLVLGEVLLFHVADKIIDDFKIDPEQLRTVGRMGGNSYTRTSERFDIERPSLEETLKKI